MTMNDIKPIETVYNGYRFRSRLEARWAVFFDAAGIEYQYEPEGFQVYLGDETVRYLPDFYLPGLSTYAEVKPNYEKLMEESEKLGNCIDFNRTPVSDGLIILGQIPYWPLDQFNVPFFIQFFWDCGVSGRFVYFDWQEHMQPGGLRRETKLAQAGWPNLFGSETCRLPNIVKDSYYDVAHPDEVNRLRQNLYIIDETPSVCVNSHWYDMIEESRRIISDHFQPCFEKARQARFEHGETPKI